MFHRPLLAQRQTFTAFRQCRVCRLLGSETRQASGLLLARRKRSFEMELSLRRRSLVAFATRFLDVLAARGLKSKSPPNSCGDRSFSLTPDTPDEPAARLQPFARVFSIRQRSSASGKKSVLGEQLIKALRVMVKTFGRL